MSVGADAEIRAKRLDQPLDRHHPRMTTPAEQGAHDPGLQMILERFKHECAITSAHENGCGTTVDGSQRCVRGDISLAAVAKEIQLLWIIGSRKVRQFQPFKSRDYIFIFSENFAAGAD